MLMGMANPMPWPCRLIAVLMPMTSPVMPMSGPPELPGLIDASVWMKSDSRALPPGARILAAQGADDAAGHGVVQAQGVADGEHALADLELVGVPQRHGLEGPVGLDLDQRDVGARVGADDPRVVLALVVEPDLDLGGAGDDVVVGQHVAVRVDDESGAEGGGPAARVGFGLAARAQRAILTQPHGDDDVDHRRADLLGELGEARGAQDLVALGLGLLDPQIGRRRLGRPGPGGAGQERAQRPGDQVAGAAIIRCVCVSSARRSSL